MSTVKATDLLAITRPSGGDAGTYKVAVSDLPHAVPATETAQGVVELATAAETTTGTDNTRAVHPAGLKAALDAQKLWDRTGTVLSPATAGDDVDLGTGDLSAAAGTFSGVISNPAISLDPGTTGSPLVRDSQGRLLVGTSSSRSAGDITAQIQLEGTTFDSASLSLISNPGATADDVAHITLAKSRSSTVGGTTVVASGDNLGRIQWAGADGTDLDSTAAEIKCEVDGTPGANDMPGRLVFSTTADGASSPTEKMRIESNGRTRFGSDIYPSTDNLFQVGLASFRWSVVFAGTGSINTSDATLKCDVADLDAAELAVASAIKGLIKKFRFVDAVELKGDNARIHVGVIAQEVKQTFIDKGLDPRRYGMFCEDELEDGSKRLGIRYDELLAFVIAAL